MRVVLEELQGQKAGLLPSHSPNNLKRGQATLPNPEAFLDAVRTPRPSSQIKKRQRGHRGPRDRKSRLTLIPGWRASRLPWAIGLRPFGTLIGLRFAQLHLLT